MEHRISRKKTHHHTHTPVLGPAHPWLFCYSNHGPYRLLVDPVTTFPFYSTISNHCRCDHSFSLLSPWLRQVSSAFSNTINVCRGCPVLFLQSFAIGGSSYTFRTGIHHPTEGTTPQAAPNSVSNAFLQYIFCHSLNWYTTELLLAACDLQTSCETLTEELVAEPHRSVKALRD